jgi:hypothetical protein
MESTERKDPTEQTESAEPTLPMERNDDFEPMQSKEFSDAIDQREDPDFTGGAYRCASPTRARWREVASLSPPRRVTSPREDAEVLAHHERTRLGSDDQIGQDVSNRSCQASAGAGCRRQAVPTRALRIGRAGRGCGVTADEASVGGERSRSHEDRLQE